MFVEQFTLHEGGKNAQGWGITQVWEGMGKMFPERAAESIKDSRRWCPLSTQLIAVCKDSCVVCACGFDWNGKWEWFCESKLCYKNYVAKMMSERALAVVTWNTLLIRIWTKLSPLYGALSLLCHISCTCLPMVCYSNRQLQATCRIYQ